MVTYDSISVVLEWAGVWCEGVGVVEGYCCFCVIERFLEGRAVSLNL